MKIPAKKMIVFALNRAIKMDIGTNQETLLKFTTLLDIIKKGDNFPEVLKAPAKKKIYKC